MNTVCFTTQEVANFFETISIGDMYLAKGKVSFEDDYFHYVARITNKFEKEIEGVDIWDKQELNDPNKIWNFDYSIENLKQIKFSVLEKINSQTHPEYFL